MGKFSRDKFNKNISNKKVFRHMSILLNFISLSVFPQGFLSLNSERHKNAPERYTQHCDKGLRDNHAENAVISKDITFMYTLSGSDDELPFRMTRLYDLESQNLETWILNLRNIAGKMKWNDEVVLHVLEELVDDDYHHIMADKKVIETKLQSLINAKYPRTDTFIYLKKIENIKQENYVLIKDYQCNSLNDTKIRIM
ncbi:hypothetical protein DMUE_0113 [Dictyocoela muelleri]|nr:hypothetical protein DMUE_0113 [Dictyocoela muelleri]